jgi:aconitate hydratase
MFARHDPDFHDRAQEWGGGIIVAGENYGQGSSREHAALIPVFLGVRVIVARSYARIHRRNLIAAGIAPLLLPEGSRDLKVGQQCSFSGLRRAVLSGSPTARVDVEDLQEPISLRMDFTDGERAVLAAGGLLAHIRKGGRGPVTEFHSV